MRLWQGVRLYETQQPIVTSGRDRSKRKTVGVVCFDSMIATLFDGEEAKNALKIVSKRIGAVLSIYWQLSEHSMHVVLLNPKAETTEDEINTALAHMRALPRAIPGIVKVIVGRSQSKYNQGYTYGFITQFTDAAHLQDYIAHPAHQRVREELQRISQRIVDFDLEQQ